MFKEIQHLFIKTQQEVQFLGEYSIPDEAIESLNGEATQIYKKNDRAIIHSLNERVWRMTGYRWRCVIFPFKCQAVLTSPQS